MKESKEKSKALNLAIEKLEKTYGKGTIMKLSDENIVKIPSIPTGSLSLDIALGIGGIPKGRVVEIFGPESSGLSNNEISFANYVLKFPTNKKSYLVFVETLKDTKLCIG